MTKRIIIFASLLVAGCSRGTAPASFTLIEHTAGESTWEGGERFVFRYDHSGNSTIIATRCGFTKYSEGKTNKGFCPAERLPVVGTSMSECTEGEPGPSSKPCVFRAAGGYLVVREGYMRQNDEMDLFIDSEKVGK